VQWLVQMQRYRKRLFVSAATSVAQAVLTEKSLQQLACQSVCLNAVALQLRLCTVAHTHEAPDHLAGESKAPTTAYWLPAVREPRRAA